MDKHSIDGSVRCRAIHTPIHRAARAGLQGAIIAAHATWSRQEATAADGSAGAATEEGLGGEDFTFVEGIDVDEPAPPPAMTPTPAGVVTSVCATMHY